MEQTFITKIAIVLLAAIVVALLMGFYSELQVILARDRLVQDQRDALIEGVFDQAHTKSLIILLIRNQVVLK